MNPLQIKSIVLGLFAALGLGALLGHGYTSPFTVANSIKIPSLGDSLSPGSNQDDFQKIVLPFLKQHCLECHTGEESESGLDLSRFDSQLSVNAGTETWESIIEAIDDQYMPPAERATPRDKDVAELKSWFQNVLKTTGSGKPKLHIRRLNRVEYENTIRDLLRMDRKVFSNPGNVLLIDNYFQPDTGQMPRHVLALSHFNYLHKQPPVLPSVADVPSDPPVEHGFSNDQTGLSFSPLQLERYLELAYSIVSDRNMPQLSGLWEPLFAPTPMPVDAAAQQRLARARLRPFMERAFRRAATDNELNRYALLFDQALAQNGDYTDAMREAVVGILVSPSFLFRRDFADSSVIDGRVDPFHMASRLSYFLWGSIADAPLMAAARENRLDTDQQLLLQVRRMMKDKRIKSLATDFGMQWLQVSKLASVRPDRDLFPTFYMVKEIPPSVSMMIEQLLLFETILIEDRSIGEFIQTDIGYLNRQLIDWYQLNPKELLGYTPSAEDFEDFFRIKWPNKHRGGVITSGATLVGTSATTRTSPVYRGAWIMDVIFNRPPPSPPADVPALEDDNHKGIQAVNIREKLKQHRDDPNCAVCHDRIDPYGFALENFDAVGKWRHKYADGEMVDTNGEIFEEPYEGAARFKAVLLRHEDEFVRGFVEHMLKYALGRQLELADAEVVDSIVAKVKQRGMRFSAVVEEIVLSDLFRSRQQL